MTSPRKKLISRFVLGVLFIVAGVLHFLKPHFYEQMIPPQLPSPSLLVLISGIAEVAGGVGVLLPWPPLRRLAAWGLVALLVAVFPANLYMWYGNVAPDGPPLPWYFHAIRLPLQGVLIWWAYSHTKRYDSST